MPSSGFGKPSRNPRTAHSASVSKSGSPLTAPLLAQARAAFHEEDEEGALELLAEVLKLEPDNLRARYLTALCAHLLTREELLEQTCLRALEIAPRHPYTIACEAVRYLYLANFARAEMLCEHAIRALPEDTDLHIGLGIVHEYSGDREKGADAFRRVLRLDPDNVRAHMSLGGLYAMEGEFESAMEEYQQAKELAPALESPHQRLGRDYYYEGLIEQAATEFARAADDDPEDPASYFFLMDCYRRMERGNDSLDVYEDIQRRFGDDPAATAGFYEQFNMRAEAVASLERLAANEPDSTDILLRLSAAYREAGQLDRAIDICGRVCRAAPDNPAAAALMGDLCFAAGRYEPAVQFSRRAVELDPDAHAAYILLADALLFLGRQEDSWAVVREMEQVRKEAWESYQAKFSGQDRADAGL